jgi:hypothetical protein
VGYVEDLRGKQQGQGRPRWRARYRDPSGRERSKSFTRKVDAERFLVAVEDAKLRGAYVDPAAGAARARDRQHHPGHLRAPVLLGAGGLADRLEQARAAALAHRERTQRGPAVVVMGERAGG